MKKTLILLFAVIVLCSLSSCQKEAKHPLEGVWGFMSEENITKDINGKIIDQHKYEYNPFNPTNSSDMKVEFKWISDNDYNATSFAWAPESKSWKEMGRTFKVSIQNGNRFLTERMNGEMFDTGTITISGDSFTIEMVSNILSGLGDEPAGTHLSIETYKRRE